MVCGCLDGLVALFRVPTDHEEERANFERTVQFLASVPLFRKQLPRSELPKVAQHLSRKLWQPGQRLVRQGETGRAFFLIESGEALVVTGGMPGEPEETRARLCAGDYFGGHTLMTERPNVATIVAGGPDALVTLSMSRAAFEDSPLKRWLRFPKRPAIYDSEDGGCRRMGSERSAFQPPQLSQEETEFISNAVSQNLNLRALLQASADKCAAIAAVAERRAVKRGTLVAQCGDMGNEFFIIRHGCFEVDLDTPHEDGQQSAEAAVERSGMAERLMRKQHFLQSLAQVNKNHSGRTMSINVASMAMSRESSGRRSSMACDLERKRTGSLKNSWAATLTSPKNSWARATTVTSPKSSLRRSATKQPRQGRSETDMSETTPVSDPQVLDEILLGPGESFGELSLLYNSRREATFRAHEDSVVYVVDRKHFRSCFNRKGFRFDESLELLEEVRALAVLLSSERYELACNATGQVHFKPGERVLTQGKTREARLWYIICSGNAVIWKNEAADGKTGLKKIAELHRACHFGERSLLRGDVAAHVSIDAGCQGMSCLTFEGDLILPLLRGAFTSDDGNTPCLQCSVDEWFTWKASGWDRQVSTASNSMGTHEGRQVDLDTLRCVCELGRGGYGQVKLVADTNTHQRYALKALSKGYICSQGAERLVQWERELLSMVRSPFVIRLHNCMSDAQCIYFLLEAALGGCLLDVLRECPEVLREDAPRGSSAAFYVACLTAAVEHLHERRIVHRDLKPENVLLDERGYAKLCDMGFARFVLGKTNTLAGTPEYMAPEMIDFPHSHDMNVDWWALGVVSFELLAGQTPFEDEGICEPMGRLLALRRSQERGSPSFPFHFPHVARGFVKALLQKMPHRLGATGGASAVREHPMYKVLKFDFEAFHEHLMPSPLSKEWTEPGLLETDDLGMSLTGVSGSEYLGILEDDALFLPATSELPGWDA